MSFPHSIKLAIGGAILVCGAIALHATSTLTAQERSSGGDLDRAAVEEIVREYILNNPEILFEAADRYGQQQANEAAERAEAEVKANFATLASAASGFAIGAGMDKADVVVVEFFDYHCGYCRRATDFVFDLTENDEKIRLVFQELPVVHEKSRAVSVAALAAPSGESYAALHRALMEHDGLIEADQIERIAKRAGVNYKPFAQKLADNEAMPAIEAKLATSMDIARAAGIDGTPGFIIASPDGQTIRIVSGFNGDAVRAAIDAVRKS